MMTNYTNAWTVAYWLMMDNGWQPWTLGPRPRMWSRLTETT